MAMTTDFTGAYDYEKEEANSEFNYFMELQLDYTIEEMMPKIEKLQAHWEKVLTPESMSEFKLHWNTRCNDAGLSLGFYMV